MTHLRREDNKPAVSAANITGPWSHSMQFFGGFFCRVLFVRPPFCDFWCHFATSSSAAAAAAATSISPLRSLKFNLMLLRDLKSWVVLMIAAEMHFVIQKVDRYSENTRGRLRPPPPLLGGTLVAGSNLVHIADTWFGPTAVITHSLATVRVSVLACFLRCSGGVRLGKWISQLTALSLLHRGNTGAALETPEDGHNLITAATHTHSGYCGATHTLYIQMYISVCDVFLTEYWICFPDILKLSDPFAHLESEVSEFERPKQVLPAFLPPDVNNPVFGLCFRPGPFVLFAWLDWFPVHHLIHQIKIVL